MHIVHISPDMLLLQINLVSKCRERGLNSAQATLNGIHFGIEMCQHVSLDLLDGVPQ